MHGLDANLIKRRVMRRSYGIISQPAFREGHHPVRLRFIDNAGVARCKSVMQWYARKVCFMFISCLTSQGMEMANDYIVTHTFTYNVKEWVYRRQAPLPHSSILYYSEDDPPPEYANPSGGIATALTHC